MFELSPALREKRADLLAARDFPAPHRVVLNLDPSNPGDDLLIDQITGWAMETEWRCGRVRRTIHGGKGLVVFEFETAVDAVCCQLRFDCR